MGALREPSWRPGPDEAADEAVLARLPNAVRSLVVHLGGIWLDGALHVRGAVHAPAWHSIARAWDGPGSVNVRLGLPATDIPVARTTFGDELVVRGHDVLRIAAGTTEPRALGTSIGGLVAELERDAVRLLALDPSERASRPESRPRPEWEDLLGFWFGGCECHPERIGEQVGRWFMGGPDFDTALRERFGPLLERAERGDDFPDWRRVPRGAVAAVLVLDQLPRNLRRDDPRAFALDARARAVADAAIADGVDLRVRAIEAAFLYLPLEHAESLDAQERCVAAFDALARRAPVAAHDAFASFCDFARRHHALIERFGRFPHRNAVLGRASRPEEERHLAEGGDRF